jgi:hypothetical protein
VHGVYGDLASKFFDSIGSDFLDRFGTWFLVMNISVINFSGFPHGFSTAKSVLIQN